MTEPYELPPAPRHGTDRDLVAALLGATAQPGEPPRLRFGKVRQANPLRVEVGAGGVPLPVALLASAYTPVVGDSVALLQQGKQMLCIGRYTPSA